MDGCCFFFFFTPFIANLLHVEIDHTQTHTSIHRKLINQFNLIQHLLNSKHYTTHIIYISHSERVHCTLLTDETEPLDWTNLKSLYIIHEQYAYIVLFSVVVFSLLFLLSLFLSYSLQFTNSTIIEPCYTVHRESI